MSKHCLRCLNNSFFEDVSYLQKGTPPTCGRECLCSREPRTWPWLVDDLHIGAGGILPLVCPCSRTAAASYTSSSSAPQWWSLLTLPAFKIISKQSHIYWTKKKFQHKVIGQLINSCQHDYRYHLHYKLSCPCYCLIYRYTFASRRRFWSSYVFLIEKYIGAPAEENSSSTFIAFDFLGVSISTNMEVMLTFRKWKEFVFVSHTPSDLPVAIPLPWVMHIFS